MRSSGKEVGFLVVIVLLCLAAIVLSAAAFGTDYWITQDYSEYDANSTTTNISYHLNMGLFRGQLNRADFQKKNIPFKLKDYKDESGFMNFPLWVSTILFISLGILFGVVTSVFSVVNSFTTPIEEITGITGLYLWNNLSTIFSMTGVLVYVGEYIGNFRDVLMTFKTIEELQGECNEPSKLGYSFYLVVGATGLYLINNCFIFLSTYKVDNKKTLPATMDHEGTADGVIMLY